MNERLKLFSHLMIPLMVTALIVSCNIFDITSDVEKTPIEKAEDAIREGDYEEAHKILANSVKDSTDSHALYLDAKATLHEAGIDIFEIVELIEGQNVEDNQELGMLSIVDDLPKEGEIQSKTAWYQANMKVSANLSKIFNEETTGPFEPDDIALGYTVSTLMSGILGLRDTNRDMVINDEDFNLNVVFNESADGYDLGGGVFEADGIPQEFTGLEVFLGGYAAKAATPGPAIGAQGYEPDDINELIAFVLSVLEKSSESLKVLLEKNTSFDPEEIDKYIAEIASIINFYWYNDGIDNDEDGRTDEETINGIDDDGDGYIDEDSAYHPADTTPGLNTQYIPIWQQWKNR